MQPSSYSTLLWRRKWVIAGTFVVAMLVVALGTLILTPTYQATATLRVRTAARGSLDWVDYDIAYTERLMNTYARLATSDPVLQEVAQRLGGQGFPAVWAEVIPETELMTITAEGEDPALVAEAANTLTAILANQSENLHAQSIQLAGEILAEDLAQAEADLADAQANYAAAVAETPDDVARLAALSRALDVRQQAYTSLLGQYERARITEQMRASALSIVELATVPSAPTAPNVLMNLVLGGILGLAGGVALAVLFQKLDRRLYGLEDVTEVTGLPVLAAIGHTPAWRVGWRSLILGDGGASIPEMVHRLRASLASQLEGSAYTLLITSAQPGEGKSTVATNLAIAMGQAGRRVVLVDGNLHRPVLHTYLGPHNEAGSLYNGAGLTAVLEGKWTLSEALQATAYPGVWALTSGPLRAKPAELLSGPWMADLLESLESQFDAVLIDGPSVLGAADAAVLAAMADEVLLVVSVAEAGRDTLQAARAELDRIRAPLVGAVANRVSRTGDERFRRYYDHSPAARGGEAAALPVAGRKTATSIRVPAPENALPKAGAPEMAPGVKERPLNRPAPGDRKQHEPTR